MARLTLLPSLALCLTACSSPPDPRTDDTPTTGEVVVLADEDFRTLIEGERMVFEHYYKTAHLRLYYLPEAELMRAMISDSVRAVFTTRRPGPDQMAYFRSRKISPDLVPILTDAIAVVRGPSAGVRTESIPGVRARLSRKDGPPMLVIGRGTSVARTLADSLFAGDGTALLGTTAVRTTDDLIAAVGGDTMALGLLSLALISDLDDPVCRAFREQLVLVPVAAIDTGRAVLPNQSSLADGSYPLRRTLYAVLTEWKSGLGTGFVSFVAGHKGQRIVLKSGLAPNKVPAREVLIVNE